jgi:hypothetical protein
VPSYNLLLELLLKHKSYNYNSSLSELLSYIITLINTSNIIRIRQTEHIKNKAEIITVAEVFEKALEAIVALETIAVFGEVKAVVDITCYLHAKKSVIFIIS